MPTKLEWAREMVEKKRSLFSPRTFAIGIAEHLWSGEDGDSYVDPGGTPVAAPVIHLSTGHDLLADPEHFVELEPHEADFFAVAQVRLNTFLVGGMATAKQMNIPEPTAMLLLVATLRGQLAALEATTAASSPA